MEKSRVYGFVPFRYLICAALVLSIATSGVVVHSGPLARQNDDEVTLESDLVTVDVTVTDAQGRYVTDVKQSEVRVLEDGVERPIDFFAPSSQRDTSGPIAVVLALDISGSITRPEIGLQREAALKFVGLVKPDSQFSVVSFNHEVNVLQKFTSNAKDVGKAFDKIKDVGGSTRLFDALDLGVSMLSKTSPTRGGRRVRRVAIVITDGYDSSSTIAPVELIRRAQTAGVTIFSITLPSFSASITGSSGPKERILTILDAHGVVPATGGQDFEADTKDFGPVFRAIAEEIASGYQVAFYPPADHRKDGKFHKVQVVVSRPGVLSRANRQGYQAPAK